MSIAIETDSVKEKILSFLWQHVLLTVSLFIMTFGVALSVSPDWGAA